jgi:hypothetical protein
MISIAVQDALDDWNESIQPLVSKLKNAGNRRPTTSRKEAKQKTNKQTNKQTEQL